MPLAQPDDHKLRRIERQTTHELHAFIGEFLKLLASHFGGQTTINQLRVGSYIGLRSQHENANTSNKDIADALGISRPTASRIVREFMEKHWVEESMDDNDGRKRSLKISKEHPAGDKFERDFRVLMNVLLDKFARGEIVMVDPTKRSF